MSEKAQSFMVMPRLRTLFRSIVLGIVLLSTACAVWFVPESRSRGHIFDEASRGAPQFGDDDGRYRLKLRINRQFPPGTPLADLIRHLEGAGGACSSEIGGAANAELGTRVCTYENINYFAYAIAGMGEPTFHVAHNEWTVFVSHSGGLIKGYEIDGTTITTYLSRDEYREGLARQRAEEELQRNSAED